MSKVTKPIKHMDTSRGMKLFWKLFAAEFGDLPSNAECQVFGTSGLLLVFLQ